MEETKMSNGELGHLNHEKNFKAPETSVESVRSAEKILNTEHQPEQKKHVSGEQLNAIKASVEKQAISGKEYSRGEDSETKQHPVLVSKQLKQMAFSRALTRTRKHLSAPSKALSKFVHNPAIDKVSEVSSKTVARPSALLSASAFSFIGSLILLLAVKKYGFEYNFFAFILLFVMGYIAGLFIELLYRSVSRKRRA